MFSVRKYGQSFARQKLEKGTDEWKTAPQYFAWHKQKCFAPNSSDKAWPAHSPDLNPLHVYFWTVAQSKIYDAKPSTIAELINVVM